MKAPFPLRSYFIMAVFVVSDIVIGQQMTNETANNNFGHIEMGSTNSTSVSTIGTPSQNMALSQLNSLLPNQTVQLEEKPTSDTVTPESGNASLLSSNVPATVPAAGIEQKTQSDLPQTQDLKQSQQPLLQPPTPLIPPAPIPPPSKQQIPIAPPPLPAAPINHIKSTEQVAEAAQIQPASPPAQPSPLQVTYTESPLIITEQDALGMQLRNNGNSIDSNNLLFFASSIALVVLITIC